MRIGTVSRLLTVTSPRYRRGRGGGVLPYEWDGEKNPQKDTNLGVAQAIFDPSLKE